MKNKKLSGVFLGLAIVVAGLVTGCEKEEAKAPTVNFIADVDGLEVIITAEATDALTWEWNYGDENTATVAGSHTYTYDKTGTYTIICTVNGDGGEATKSVEVTIASLEDLISGGPSATNGKTWVVNKFATIGKDGAGIVNDILGIHPDMALVPDNMLSLFGLGAEYDNEYTFYDDGTYVMDPVNGQVVAGLIHGVATQTVTIPSNAPTMLPFCAATYTAPENGTWALSTAEHNMVAMLDSSMDTLGQSYNVAFTFPSLNKKAKFDLSAGQFLGVYDAFIGHQTPVTILKAINANKMHIVVPIATNETNPELASLAFHITLVPKK